MKLFILALSLHTIVSAAAAEVRGTRSFEDGRYFQGASGSLSSHASRRLRATPYGGGSPNKAPTFKAFAYKGGPPDIVGVFQSDVYIGILPNGAFASTIYLGNNNNKDDFMQQIGRYTSWECTSVPGVYIATTERADIYSNGTRYYAQRCEIGKVDLEAGIYYWESSPDKCPDPATATWNTPLYRVESKAFPGATTQYCKGQAGTGFDNVGKAGVQTKQPFDTLVRVGEPIPPPLHKPEPPAFKNKGGPGETSGIWYSDELKMGELVTEDAFSSVQLQEGDILATVLGRFNSYQCSGAQGGYDSSLSFTQTFQNLTEVSSQGCTSGVVDLAADTYDFRAGNSNKCPAADAFVFHLKRANSSDALPTATEYTCNK